MATNIDDLMNKVENEGMNPQGKLSASEFNRLVRAVKENQNSVKGVKIGSGNVSYPDDEGIATLVVPTDTYAQILTIKRTVNNSDVVVANGNTILSADNNVSVKMQFIEYQEKTIEGETTYTDTNRDTTLKIIKDGNVVYQDIYTARGRGSTEFRTLNLSSFISTGSQSISIQISNTTTGTDYTNQFYVIDAGLHLSVPTGADWFTKAKDISGVASPSLQMLYYIQGPVQKTLEITLYGDEETTDTKSVSYSAAVDDNTTAQLVSWSEPATPIGFFTSGVHRVSARLICTIENQTVSSNVVENEVMVIDGTETAPLIAIQNPVTRTVNYETISLFDYTIYAPAAPTGGSSVRFDISNNNHSVTYLTSTTENVPNQTNKTFNGTIEIESALTELQVAVFCKINGTDVRNGYSILGISVDNSVNYSPTSGYTFYLNPKLRSNNESNPATILNSADNNSEIQGVTFSNMSWIDGMDGWLDDENGHRCLRILAGSKVTIPYNAYAAFIADGSAAHSLTIELDFAVRNITNEEDPVFLMGNGDASSPLGVYMKPLNGAFSLASEPTWLDKDVSWQENTRTHIVFDIQHDYIMTNNDNGNTATQPIVRTFVGGIVNRECRLNIEGGLGELTADTDACKSIIIGQSGCDIDIYAIRIYRGDNGAIAALSTAQVMQNRLSGFGTGAERLAFKTSNDLLVSNKISFAKARAHGLNCVVWHGQPVNSRTGNVKKYGYAELYRYVDGVEDKTHSGILYGVQMKGQGTTAMNYAEWNIQFQDAKDNATVLSPNGKREFIDLDGNATGKFGYRLESSDPLAAKLVGKVNYASSMQSHKMGACNLYNDLYRLICGSNSITDFSSGQRVTVKEEPFLYFLQETEGDADNLKVFQGLMTFGPGKADKPTWGVSDKSRLKAGDCIIEGADNNNPLTDMRVPFTDDGFVSYNKGSEAFMYNGSKNLNFDYGCTADLFASEATITDEMKPWNAGGNNYTQDEEVPTVKQVKLWQPIINFLYLTNTGIRPWEGTLEELQQAAANGTYVVGGESVTFDRDKAYWMTAGDPTGNTYSKYDLFRAEYETANNVTTCTFVPAGLMLTKGNDTYRNFACLSDNRSFYASSDVWNCKENGNYISLNLSDMLIVASSFFGSTISTVISNERTNLIFINALCIIFRHYVDQNLYIHKNSNLFHHEMMKLWAGTDNRSKNTYYRYNTTLKNMEMNDDDLDTIFKTNNVGKQSKPYYILEQDPDSTGENGYHWQGQNNALNNALEFAYSDRLVNEVAGITTVTGFSAGENYALELPRMMNLIFTNMKALVGSATMPDGTAIPQTVAGCFMKYFLRIQKYFPAITYNETSRIRYEPAFKFHGKLLALTQSLGDQYDAESEYINRRAIFISGYAREISSTDTFTHRGRTGTYAMVLKPHFWLYPTAMPGGSQSSGFDAVRTYGKRVESGASASFSIDVSGDGTITLYNANNMKEIGNTASWPVGSASADSTFVLISERLVKFECHVENGDSMNFAAQKIDVSKCVNTEHIDIHNASAVMVMESLINLIRLKYLDLRGTGVSSVTLPQTTALETLLLPANFTTLTLTNTPNLETLSLDGYSSLKNISITCQVSFDTKQFLINCMTNNASLESLTLTDLTTSVWNGVSQALMEYICDIPNVQMTGEIAMSGLNFDGKVKLIQKFGNIDSSSNPLHITYTLSQLTNVYIAGEGYFCENDKVVDAERPAANGLRRDVFNDGTAVTQDGVTKYNGNIIKAYRLVSDADNQNSISSATWSLTGAGVTSGQFELVHPTAGGGWESHSGGNYTSMICYIRCKKPIVDETTDDSDAVKSTRVDLAVNCTLYGNNATMSATYRAIAAFNRNAKRGDFVYHDGWFDGLTVISSVARYMKINDIDGNWFDMTNITLQATKDATEFVLLTSQPSNWSTMYMKYYTYSGGVYSHPTGSSAPTFAANTYYYSKYRKYIDANNTESDAIYIVRETDGHIVRNKEVVGICHYVSDQDPTYRLMFAAHIDNSTTNQKYWGIYPPIFPNVGSVLGLTYQDPFDDEYIVTTSQPSDWTTNYGDYYTENNGVYSSVTGTSAPTWQANTYYAKVAEKDVRVSVGVDSNVDGRLRLQSSVSGTTLTLGNNTMRVIDGKMRPLIDSELGSGYNNPGNNNIGYRQIGKRNINFGSQSDNEEYNSSNRERMTLNKLHKLGLANHLQTQFGRSVGVPVGQFDTLAVLLWRNRTLMGTPITIGNTETTVFKEYINGTQSEERLYQVDENNDKLVTDTTSSAVKKLSDAENDFEMATPNVNVDKTRMFPAASYAYLYEPYIRNYQNELRKEYGRTRWFLPSIGELCMLFVQMVCSEGVQYEDGSYATSDISYAGTRTYSDNTMSWIRGAQTTTGAASFNPDVDMFEMQTLINMFSEIKNGNPLRIDDIRRNGLYYSSSEQSANTARYVSFSTASYSSYYSKSNNMYALPTTVF